MISSDIPDWTREHKPFFAWQPAKSLLASIRCYQRYNTSLLPWFCLIKVVAVIRHRFWSAVTGADIPLNCNIAGGLLIPHPNGIVIHPDAKIGPNCLIFQQVTVGSREGHNAPIIAGHVDIGAGAKILGDITIGAHAKIGANAVVLINVPSGKAAVGIPAKII
ncbi:MAG: serine acetyltransferase [Methylophilaceae bacterium]|nr:serine acetyltransferase [Methylophilaceae bacterium]